MIFLFGFSITFYEIKSFNYQNFYKNTIIKLLVTNYDKNLQYTHNKKIPKALYDKAEFENYAYFTSNDYIHGKIDGIIPIVLGDICTKSLSESDGITKPATTIFQGLFSTIKLPTNLNSNIKILSNKTNLQKLLKNKDNLTMDSQEFEKNFDIFSNNKLLAMQILTSDIMDYIVSFKSENNINFEIIIKNEYLYLRIHCSDMFEPKTTEEAVDYDTLYKYYQHLDFICTLNKKIYITIREKNL